MDLRDVGGDIPLDHLVHYVAFIFFTMALLGDRERPDGKLHYSWTRQLTEEAADDRVETAAVIPRNLLVRGQVPKGYGDYRQRNQG